MAFTFIKQYLARKRLMKPEKRLHYASELLLGVHGSQNDYTLLSEKLYDTDQKIRAGAVIAIRFLLKREILTYPYVLNDIKNKFDSAPLLTKLAFLAILYDAPSDLLKEFVHPLIQKADHDLLYMALYIAPSLPNEEYLDDLSRHARNKDPTIQFIALLKWFEGIKQLPEEERVRYLVARFHTLIEVYKETGQGGNFIYEGLDKGKSKDFPEPKLYDDNTIRSLVHLLDQFEFSKRAYENAYKLIVPEYFALN